MRGRGDCRTLQGLHARGLRPVCEGLSRAGISSEGGAPEVPQAAVGCAPGWNMRVFSEYAQIHECPGYGAEAVAGELRVALRAT